MDEARVNQNQNQEPATKTDGAKKSKKSPVRILVICLASLVVLVILLLAELVVLNVSVWSVFAVTKNTTVTMAVLVLNFFLMIV